MSNLDEWFRRQDAEWDRVPKDKLIPRGRPHEDESEIDVVVEDPSAEVIRVDTTQAETHDALKKVMRNRKKKKP